MESTNKNIIRSNLLLEETVRLLRFANMVQLGKLCRCKYQITGSPFFNYSDRKFFTGFSKADLTACTLIVSIESRMAIIPAMANIHQDKSIR